MYNVLCQMDIHLSCWKIHGFLFMCVRFSFFESNFFHKELLLPPDDSPSFSSYLYVFYKLFSLTSALPLSPYLLL